MKFSNIPLRSTFATYLFFHRLVQFLAKSGLGALGPAADAVELFDFVVGEEFGFVGDRIGEARGAEVVAFAHEQGRLEIGVGLELGDRLEQLAADREGVLLDLFLQDDGVG